MEDAITNIATIFKGSGMSNFLYTLVSFVVALFFILLGVIGIILPWSTGIRSDVIQFILENTLALSLFGFGFTIIGLIIAINVFLSFKKKYYYVKTGKQGVAVDELLVHHYLQSYWEQVFPNHEVPTRLIFKKNRIKITADLPYMPRDQQKVCVERVQTDLNDILKRILGYHDALTFSLSFPKRSPKT